MKTTLISIIAILSTVLVTVAYGKNTLVTKSEFELIIDRLDNIDQMIRLILNHNHDDHSCEMEGIPDDINKNTSFAQFVY